MVNRIIALERIGCGFPPDEGQHLAEYLIDQDDHVDWSDLTIDLRKCPAGLLISAFFNSFLQHVFEELPERFDAAKKIRWEADFGFQQENIKQWIDSFNPQTPTP